MPSNVQKLLTALIGPTQNIENALQQLLTLRSVDTATGDQLDIIGKLVAQPRDGLDDATYRRYIRARISTHRSAGSTEDVIKIADLIIYDDTATYVVDTQGYAGYVLRIENLAINTTLANALLAFLQDATSAGVRVIVEYSDQLPATWFTWDTAGLGWDNGKLIGAID